MYNILHKVINENLNYGAAEKNSKERVLVEYVSANPTGPLHVGHGRGAAYGDSLSNLLETAGYNVYREYYVNDAGRQIDILTISVWLRMIEMCNLKINYPINCYQGTYINDIAKEFQQSYNVSEYIPENLEFLEHDDNDLELYIDNIIHAAKLFLEHNYITLSDFTVQYIMKQCSNILDGFRVKYDNWYSEKSLFTTNKVRDAIDELNANGFLYKKDGALWFKSTQFGDEKDRVIQRENGLYTYFASDIAYHLDKFRRGFDRVINIWGADHHGYVPRIKSALSAFGIDSEKLDVILIQFISYKQGNEKKSMSTRSGNFISMDELLSKVNVDNARYYYVASKPQNHITFFIDLLNSKKSINKVYYIQYAHARICSVLQKANFNYNEHIDFNFGLDIEHNIIDKIKTYPDVIQRAASKYDLLMIIDYLIALSELLHNYYNQCRFLGNDNFNLMNSRFTLLLAISYVIRNGLNIIGVSAPEKM